MSKFGMSKGESPFEEGLRQRGEHEYGLVLQDARRRIWHTYEGISAEHSAHMILGSLLYRETGVAAVGLQRFTFDGKERIGHLKLGPDLRKMTAAERSAEHDQGIRVGLDVDHWLRNTSSISFGMRFRSPPVPGIPNAVRWDLSRTMGYRGRGRRDRDWTATGADLETIDDPSTARVITRIKPARLRQLITAAGFPPGPAVDLWGTLVTRQEAIRRNL